MPSLVYDSVKVGFGTSVCISVDFKIEVSVCMFVFSSPVLCPDGVFPDKVL